MTQAEPSQEATTFFDVLAFIGNPVIEGLTIVAAGYFLFRMERRARRKEIAVLVAVILTRCARTIDLIFSKKFKHHISCIMLLIQLRPAHDEFRKISDKTGILGVDLIREINSVFLKIHFKLIDLEWRFRSIGPTGFQIDEGMDLDALNMEAAEYLIGSWGSYEDIADVFVQISPAISKIIDLDQDALSIDVEHWAPKKAELEKLLANHEDKEPPADDQEKTGD